MASSACNDSNMDNDETNELEIEMNKIKIGDTTNDANKVRLDYDPNWLKGTTVEKLVQQQQKLDERNTQDYSHSIYKTISKLNGKINNMSNLELIKCLRELKLDPNGKKEVLRKRLKNYHKQLNLNRENLIQKSNTDDITSPQVDYDYVCVIDFEATCDDVNTNNYPHEIIEFPIVLVNMHTRQIEDYFQEYVKPVINPILSKFCIHLTGITQDKVEHARLFENVLSNVNNWLMNKELGTRFKYAIATDGPWDIENFLNIQCYHSGISHPYWAKRWIDVRKLFSNWFNVRRCGIEKMLSYLGLQFEGQQHCGLDDAKNIARIMLKLYDDGCQLKINERLRNSRCALEKNPLFSESREVEEEEEDKDSVEMSQENGNCT